LTGGGKDLKNHRKSSSYLYKISKFVKSFIKKIVLKTKRILSDRCTEKYRMQRHVAPARGAPEKLSGLQYFEKYSDRTVRKTLKKLTNFYKLLTFGAYDKIGRIGSFAARDVPGASVFGLFIYQTVCRKVKKIILKTKRILSDRCTEKYRMQRHVAPARGAPEKLSGLQYFEKYSDRTVRKTLKKLTNFYKLLTFAASDKIRGIGSRVAREVPGASVFGLFIYQTVCRKIKKIVLRTKRIRLDRCTQNTARRCYLLYQKLIFAAYDTIGGIGSRAASSLCIFNLNQPCTRLNSKGAILIEFAICMPILIILLFYIHDLMRIKRYYSQTEFVGQQTANMIQNISQNRTDKKITKKDLWHIHRLSWLNLYPGDTMFLNKNSKFSMDHRPITAIFYVKNVGDGKASCVWYVWLRGNTIDTAEYTTNNLTTMKLSTVNYLTNVSPEKIYPTLKMDSDKPKIIIETIMERGNVGGHFQENSSEKAAMGLFLANPPMFQSSWSQMFHSVVTFTPKDGLFNETAPS